MEEYEPGMVSVIVPTYNRAALITETLESVYAQTYRPIELIIIDDGSTDNTEMLVKQWQDRLMDKHGFHISYFVQNNMGSSAARNYGLLKSKGEFIQFLDSDDVLCSKKIRAQVDILLSNPSYQVAYCAWRSLFDRGIIKHGPLQQRDAKSLEDSMLKGYLSGQWFVPHHSYLFLRKVIVDVGYWDEELIMEDDTDYLIRVLINGWKFIYVPSVRVDYRRHLGDHVSALRGKDKTINRLQSRAVIREKAYLALENKGVAESYINEYKVWYKGLINSAANYGETVELTNCSKIFQARLDEFSIKSGISIFNKILHRITGIYIIRLFRHKIGDCALAWLFALFNGFRKKDGC